MTDDPFREALWVPERPVTPDATFRESLFERVRREAERRPRLRLLPLHPGTPQQTRGPLVAAVVLVLSFAVLGAVVWPLRGWLQDRPPTAEITASTPFRATLEGSFPASAATDLGGDFEIALSYRSPDAWRIDVLGGSAPWQPLINENVSGAGSYVLWDGTRLVAFSAETGAFVPQPQHASWFSPLNLLGFSDERSGWEAACASASRPVGESIAGRPASHLRCPAPASFSRTGADVELWVDADSGLVLRLVSGNDPDQLFPPGPLAWYRGERLEVTSIRYDPSFPPGTFALPSQAPTASPETPADAATGLEVGQPVPSVAGSTLDGASVELPSDVGVPSVLYLWADWCEPCVVFPLDVLDRVFTTREDVAVTTIAVSVDPSSVKAFLRQAGLTLPVVLPEDPTSLEKQWGITGVPALLLLDAQGRLVGTYAGWSPELATADDLEAALEALVAGTPLPEIPGSTLQR